jgi:hypothetical protein
MERQTDGEGDFQKGKGRVRYRIDIVNEKIIVFEYCKNANVRHDGQSERKPAHFARGPFNQKPGKIIHHDGAEQDKQVHRDERSIEITTGNQEVKPAVPVRQQKVNYGYKGEEYEKLETVKKHWPVVG